ncbi:MAG: serine/threonine protein kinase [Candidatus Obscuribacter sp.]|nr:serine/threonine protein kinase [Candidatus Obscuribacter sp.]
MADSDDPWFKRYRWLQMLGTGGMGVIYLAQDTYSDDAFRVVKHLSSTFSDPEEKSEAVRLFRREAAMLQRLNHPGVVRFHDHYFNEDGKYYLVMDYVPGSSLETVISDFGPFNDDDSVKVGIQICEVLEYLHEQDPPIIYRDLKPSNLMLTPEGQIIFIDFGIARNFMPKESATRVVTAGYSPPEQYLVSLRPEAICMLWELRSDICLPESDLNLSPPIVSASIEPMSCPAWTTWLSSSQRTLWRTVPLVRAMSGTSYTSAIRSCTLSLRYQMKYLRTLLNPLKKNSLSLSAS